MKRFYTSAVAVLSLLGLVLPGCSLPPEPELGSEGGPGVQDAGKDASRDASGPRPDGSVVYGEGGADRSVVPPSEAGLDSSVVSTPDTGADRRRGRQSRAAVRWSLPPMPWRNAGPGRGMWRLRTLCLQRRRQVDIVCRPGEEQMWRL